jgi:hypothetical protein
MRRWQAALSAHTTAEPRWICDRMRLGLLVRTSPRRTIGKKFYHQLRHEKSEHPRRLAVMFFSVGVQCLDRCTFGDSGLGLINGILGVATWTDFTPASIISNFSAHGDCCSVTIKLYDSIMKCLSSRSCPQSSTRPLRSWAIPVKITFLRGYFYRVPEVW